MAAPNVNGRLNLTGVHQKPPASFHYSVHQWTLSLTTDMTASRFRDVISFPLLLLLLLLLFLFRVTPLHFLFIYQTSSLKLNHV